MAIAFLLLNCCRHKKLQQLASKAYLGKQVLAGAAVCIIESPLIMVHRRLGNKLNDCLYQWIVRLQQAPKQSKVNIISHGVGPSIKKIISKQRHMNDLKIIVMRRGDNYYDLLGFL